MCGSHFLMADPTLSMIQTLQQVWQRVFHRSPITASDDFFDLGGDAWLAAELFSEINNALSVRLPPVTICNAPTIAALANAFDHAQPCGPAIRLKEGSKQAVPIFMLHGIGSSVIDLVPLVRRMQFDQPVYGLEAKGNDGREEPVDSVEDSAQSFLPAIRKIQPHGPYFLLGYSFGGLVALEIAQRLEREGEEISLLVMLDSYPDRHYLSFTQYSRLLLQLARNRLSSSKNIRLGRKPQFIATGDSQPNSLVGALQRVKDAQYRALRSYRPRFYDRKVRFIRAAVPSRFPSDPIPVWSPLVRALEVETVPGEHLDLLTAGVDPLASILDKYLPTAYERSIQSSPQGKPATKSDS